MTLQQLKEQAVKRFNDIKAQAASFIDETAAPKVRELASRLGVANATAMTKRARKDAEITLESDLKGHYKITVAGSKDAVRNAFEKLLQTDWLK